MRGSFDEAFADKKYTNAKILRKTKQPQHDTASSRTDQSNRWRSVVLTCPRSADMCASTRSQSVHGWARVQPACTPKAHPCSAAFRSLQSWAFAEGGEKSWAVAVTELENWRMMWSRKSSEQRCEAPAQGVNRAYFRETGFVQARLLVQVKQSRAGARARVRAGWLLPCLSRQ